MRILGVDPGYGITGYSIIDYQGNKYKNTDKTGACLIPCSYVLGKAFDYANLISDESSKRALFKED